MSTTDENPDRDESLQMFAGIDRVYVASLYISICALSITLHLLFITGIWKLCGWKSNFSFTLLLITSALCILRFLTELIASVTALFYLRWTRYLILWRCLGSFCLASDFTVLIVNIAMTFHRFIYTVVPFTASNYLTKSVLKVVLTLIFLFFLAIVVTMNTELLILVWVDSTMSWAIMDNPAADVYELFNHLYNYGVGFINLVAFSCLFLILFRRKQLSFTRNREVRMSLQVLCMVLGNLACFVFWEFGSMIEYDALNLILTETIDLLFFDITILPYLILNRSIHSQLKTILMAKSSHSNLKMDMRIIRVHPA